MSCHSAAPDAHALTPGNRAWSQRVVGQTAGRPCAMPAGASSNRGRRVTAGLAPRGLEDLAAVHGSNQPAEGQFAGAVALRQAGDRRAAGAVQRLEKRALTHHREPRVLVVQRREQLARGRIVLAARNTDRALRPRQQPVVVYPGLSPAGRGRACPAAGVKAVRESGSASGGTLSCASRHMRRAHLRHGRQHVVDRQHARRLVRHVQALEPRQRQQRRADHAVLQLAQARLHITAEVHHLPARAPRGLSKPPAPAGSGAPPRRWRSTVPLVQHPGGARCCAAGARKASPALRESSDGSARGATCASGACTHPRQVLDSRDGGALGARLQMRVLGQDLRLSAQAGAAHHRPLWQVGQRLPGAGYERVPHVLARQVARQDRPGRQVGRHVLCAAGVALRHCRRSEPPPRPRGRGPDAPS